MANAKAGNARRPVLDATGGQPALAAADQLARCLRHGDAARFRLQCSPESARASGSRSLQRQAGVAVALLAAASDVAPASAALILVSRPSR